MSHLYLPQGGGGGAAERALRGLLLHVDVDAAYRAALGLYELPLAFMVVTHAQVRVCVRVHDHWVSGEVGSA